MGTNNLNLEPYQFATDDLINIIRQTEHDFAQQHVLEGCECLDVLDAVISLKSLIEIRECCLEIAFVGCVENSGLKVERGLHFGGTVD